MELKRIYGRMRLARFLGVKYSTIEYYERLGTFKHVKNLDHPRQRDCIYEPEEVEKAYQFFGARDMLCMTDAGHIRG
ncbi:hypothetical protein ES703_54671 [subsurface metagenome]